MCQPNTKQLEHGFKDPKTWGLLIHFFLIAWVFYMKFILRQKFSAYGAPGWSPKWDSQRCLLKNLNYIQYKNDKHITFLKFQMNCGVFASKITWSHKSVFSLQHSSKSLDSDSFSSFMKKVETSLCTIFDIMYNMLRIKFSTSFQGA